MHVMAARKVRPRTAVVRMSWHQGAEWAVVVQRGPDRILWIVSWHETEAGAVLARLSPELGTGRPRSLALAG